MAFDEQTGHPHGSLGQREVLREFDRATKDTPWWGPLLGLLLVPFFWAIFYTLAGFFQFLLSVLAWPDLSARFYSYIGSAAIVFAGGIAFYISNIRKSLVWALFESAVGLIAASYAALTLPEGGISAVVSILGGMFGVADGIFRIKERGAKAGSQTRR